jgi:hypothetical protein
MNKLFSSLWLKHTGWWQTTNSMTIKDGFSRADPHCGHKGYLPSTPESVSAGASNFIL